MGTLPVCLCCLCAGDEYGQSRQGNNNYYGHDSELTHFHWDQLEEAKQNGWFRWGRGGLGGRGCGSVRHWCGRA